MEQYYNLKELYKEWFENKSYWFSKNSKIDVYLCDKYIHYINNINNILKFKIYDKNLLISCIILLDQLPRHYKRVYNDKVDCNFYSKISIQFCKIVLENIKELSLNELCFIYLPYRHLNDVDNIYKIINIFIDKYNNSIGEDKITAKKYLYNTLNNIYKYINVQHYSNTLNIQKWQDINKQIFDIKSITNNINTSDNTKTNLYLSIYKDILKFEDESVIIVSLSGGVDSMVCLYILNIINKLKLKNIKKIIAIHINYNNRTECLDELNFINYYCNQLNIEFIFRTINEINREQCINNGLRDLYEDITKKIRLDMYNFGLIYGENIYVLLGHNKDDCFENIITNISNKNNYENLCGMDTFSKIDNIIYWRPILNISKNEIIFFANSNNIPYLSDSTPKWSMRGKIRDKLKPELYSLKNDNSAIESYFDLKDYLQNSNEVINNLIINNLINKIANNNNIYIAIYNIDEINSFKYLNICILYFKRLYINITYKAIIEFKNYIIDYMINFKSRKILLNKNFYIIINKIDNEYHMEIIKN